MKADGGTSEGNNGTHLDPTSRYGKSAKRGSKPFHGYSKMTATSLWKQSSPSLDSLDSAHSLAEYCWHPLRDSELARRESMWNGESGRKSRQNTTESFEMNGGRQRGGSHLNETDWGFRQTRGQMGPFFISETGFREGKKGRITRQLINQFAIYRVSLCKWEVR